MWRRERKGLRPNYSSLAILLSYKWQVKYKLLLFVLTFHQRKQYILHTSYVTANPWQCNEMDGKMREMKWALWNFQCVTPHTFQIAFLPCLHFRDETALLGQLTQDANISAGSRIMLTSIKLRYKLCQLNTFFKNVWWTRMKEGKMRICWSSTL